MWRRPPGPPHVWKIFDVVDSGGKLRKFSIAEIPEDRYEEVIEHLSTIFIRDEPLCACLGAINEPESISRFQVLWRTVLSQGISIAVFEITDNREKSVLAGVNILYYGDKELDKVFKSMERNSSQVQKVIDFAVEACTQADPRTIYNVDHFLGGFGLSVDPKYRGMRLARELLAIRDEIGKAYNIQYTSTIFSGPFSQGAAASAGFRTDLESNYNEVFDENGQLLFAKINFKSSKVMSKRMF